MRDKIVSSRLVFALLIDKYLPKAYIPFLPKHPKRCVAIYKEKENVDQGFS